MNDRTSQICSMCSLLLIPMRSRSQVPSRPKLYVARLVKVSDEETSVDPANATNTIRGQVKESINNKMLSLVQSVMEQKCYLTGIWPSGRQ